MFAYIVRRVAYAVPILLGVNVLVFVLFFFVSSPDDMARQILGDKREDPRQIENWKRERGYHLPKAYNAAEPFPSSVTQTIFWQKSMRLFTFEFGLSDGQDRVPIGKEIRRRIPYSLCLTVPIFICGILLNITISMIVAFYRGTYVDLWALVVCVVMMSVSQLFYILGGQWLIAKTLRLVPVSGFDTAGFVSSIKFLVLPWLIALIGGIGGGVRYNRTIFLEEINKDYIRTARAKGLSEAKVLFKHALKNAMLPILTSVVVSIPFLIMGSLLLETFFGIPGLGGYTITGFAQQDFAVVRSMVFLGSVLYVIALVCVDISYTLVDPRIRLK
jgi:peptide/nickel transport system permease protein